MGTLLKKINAINTIMSVVGAVATTYELMNKTFKWYEKKYGNKPQKEITRPIVKGA